MIHHPLYLGWGYIDHTKEIAMTDLDQTITTEKVTEKETTEAPKIVETTETTTVETPVEVPAHPIPTTVTTIVRPEA